MHTAVGTYARCTDSVSNALHKEPPPLRRRPRCTRIVHPRGHVFDSVLSHACMIVSIVIVATCSSINNPSFEALLLLPHRRTAPNAHTHVLHAACEHLIVKLDLLSIAVVVQELAQESRAG